MNEKIVIGASLAMLYIGYLCNQAGFTSPMLSDALPKLEGWVSVFNLAVYTVDSLSAFAQIITFQVQDMPVFLNTILFLPIAYGMSYLLFKLVRGGG